MQVLSKIPVWVWSLIIGIGLGLLLRGCEPEPETITIERPIPEIIKTEVRDTVRFAIRDSRFDTIRDTITNEILDVRLDTLLKVDTLKIVDAWLTEVAKYDTTLGFSVGFVNVRWQNYQNLSEHLEVTLMPKKGLNHKRIGVLMFAKAGIQSDFKSIYKPTIGGGLLIERKSFIFGADYGYSGQHTINGVVGYRLR